VTRMRVTKITCDACGIEVAPGAAISLDVTAGGVQERYDLGPECAPVFDLSRVMKDRADGKAPKPAEPVSPAPAAAARKK
jgi:hypothetical protein